MGEPIDIQNANYQQTIAYGSDYWISHALSVIESTYGDRVSVIEKDKDLRKFGRNPNVGTSKSTIWFTGQDEANETYVADNVNSIDTISSSSASDTEVVRVEGHTMVADVKTFVVQTATLNGQNKVVLTTPLNRLTRISHNDDSSTDLVGEIYGYEDTAITSGKPTDTTKIHITVSAGENQSEKASTSLSSQDYWIITGISSGYLEKTGSNTAQVSLEVREQGGVFKPVSKPLVMSTGDNDQRVFKPYVIVPPNSDVRLIGISSTTGQDITADIHGVLAKIM